MAAFNSALICKKFLLKRNVDLFTKYRYFSGLSKKQKHIDFPLNIMARKDDITGKGAMNGYRSSKSNNKTKHKFQQNLQKKKFYVPEEDKWVTLKVSAKTLRTINKKGISAVLNEAREKGTLIKDV